MENEQPRQCIIPLHKPSTKELAFFFASGILVSVPMALFFSNVYPYVSLLISTALLAPFVEELSQSFPAVLQARRNRAINSNFGRLNRAWLRDLRVFPLRCLFRCSPDCEDSRRHFPCFKRIHNRLRHRQKEPVALLPNFGSASCSKQLFRGNKHQHRRVCRVAGCNRRLPFGLELLP